MMTCNCAVGSYLPHLTGWDAAGGFVELSLLWCQRTPSRWDTLLLFLPPIVRGVSLLIAACGYICNVFLAVWTWAMPEHMIMICLFSPTGPQT